eukprot:COSAG01_NODE_25039_length_757_cov_3.112462_1_plen_29_part_10
MSLFNNQVIIRKPLRIASEITSRQFEPLA